MRVAAAAVAGKRDMAVAQWVAWVDAAVSSLDAGNRLYYVRPVSLPPPAVPESFDGLGPWDRRSVEVAIGRETFAEWLSQGGAGGCEAPVAGRQEEEEGAGGNGQEQQQLVLFSGNDFLCLSSHPAVRKAASKAAEEHGMGPRGSAVICGYTTYHQSLEESLARLKRKQSCVLCPTGYAANVALMTALGSVSSILQAAGAGGSSRRRLPEEERVAVFSDELNHVSIIDGIRLVERQGEAKLFVYRHCDTAHLDALLSRCSMEKKVVVTDSLFSMEGDFAPLKELIALRKKHGFLLVIDEAHGTFVCGENGGGVTEMLGCDEGDIDVCVGSLSKAAGCQGGFIACSNGLKRLIQSRGRSFVFSTTLPVPMVAALNAAVYLSKKEKWRRMALWSRVREFGSLTRLHITSPIVSVVVGSEERALRASRHVLGHGFHVTQIRPPAVPADSCRLRITLSAAHSSEDVARLAAALSPWISSDQMSHHAARL